ncbi:MAG: hypothetical protein KatS3mg052_0047 [Candidatus Roseilinea sp.]|nr:MAG: hypothetical protein KatS3mg052_0047 [Candidatus Roseilinea sp.]
MTQLRTLLRYAIVSISALAIAGQSFGATSAIDRPRYQIPPAAVIESPDPSQSIRPTPRPTPSPTPTPTKAPVTTAGKRVEERDGGFAYIPPAGWRTAEVSMSSFKVLFAPSDGSGFTPNVNFIIDESEVDLETYVELAIEELKSTISGFALLKEERLATDQDSDVVKLTANSTLQGRRLRQVFYIVALGPRWLIVTYTRLQNSQQRYDRDVDNFVKTIELLEVEEEQSQPSRHSEPDGGFSYVIPEGWELEDIPNAEFKSLVNTGEEGSFKPTVAFFTLDDPAPIDQAFRRKYRSLLPNRLREFYGDARGARLIRDSLFTTDTGYDAAQFVMEGTVDNQRAQITAYIVDIEGRKIAALYARPRGSSPDSDEQIEAMINTLGLAEAGPATDDEAETLEDGRHYEPLGNFSYNLPPEWRLKSPQELNVSDTEFSVLIGPVSQNFAPNILFLEEAMPGKLSDYVSSLTRQLRSSGHRISSEPQERKTDDGLTYVRFTTTSTDDGQQIQQVFYVFPEQKRVVVGIYTRLAQRSQASLDGEVEAVMQSFRFGR